MLCETKAVSTSSKFATIGVCANSQFDRSASGRYTLAGQIRSRFWREALYSQRSRVSSSLRLVAMDRDNERRTELKRLFGNFLDRDHQHGEYDEKLKTVMQVQNVETGRLRLEVNLHDIREYNQSLLEDLLKDPAECVSQFEEALDEYARTSYPKILKENQRIQLGFTGEFGANRVSPRQLSASFISALVNLEGIVTKCTIVRPKVATSVHYCAATGHFSTKHYRDAASIDGMPTGSVYPTVDENDNPLVTEYGLSTYTDHQTVTVQELPETAPPGQLPRSAEVTLEADLVDSCKPGDRVSFVGIYKALPPRAQGSVSGMLKAILLANSVRQLTEETRSADVSVKDADDIRKLAESPDIVDQLANSLAPSIYGHKTIKKGLLLQLLGGRERQLENGTHLRGDINCLLVGDPGVAKSQMLRAIMNVAPLAVSTTGKGSSGVGLTAAVTTDKDSGERRLEAGAMVLADRGVVCIDEFDKMNDQDRVAIHEVMEQQTVTIAKAGIQTSLNARCSVLAAANPLYGSYDTAISITRNINLPDSLLSRFDLLFVVLDNLTQTQDRAIAGHVLGQHRYRAVGDDGRSAISEAHHGLEEEEEEQGTQERASNAWMYCKYNSSLHGPLAPGAKPPLSVACLRKYIAVAKADGSALTLTEEATEVIGDFYAELRSESRDNALPVTVRTLETIIRLSTAVAKARLHSGVLEEDVREAKALMMDMFEGNLHGTKEGEEDGPQGGDGPRGGDDNDDEDGPQGGDEEEEVERMDAVVQDSSGRKSGDADPAAGVPASDLQASGSRGSRSGGAASKRPRPQSSNRSNDENDPGEDGQARGQPRRRSGRVPFAEASLDGEEITEAQMDKIRDAVAEIFKARSWTGTGSVTQVVEKLSEGGSAVSEAVVKQGLKRMAREYEEDMEANVPVAFEEGAAEFYES